MVMLTHEIKTPLAAIAMLIASIKSSPEAFGHVQMTLGEVKSIIDRCIQNRRTEHGSKAFAKTTFDIDAILQQMIQSRLHITRIRYGRPGASLLRSDEQAARMLLNTQLENGRLYGAVGKAVRVRLKPCMEHGTAGVQILVENRQCSTGWPDLARVYKRSTAAPTHTARAALAFACLWAAGFVNRLKGSIRYTPNITAIGFELWSPP